MPLPPRLLLLSAAAASSLSLPIQGAAQPAIAVPELAVTASPVAGGDGSFVPVTTLDQPALAAAAPRSLGEALADQPGIAATSFAPGASRPIIRGLDNFRVRLQENGFGAGDASAFGEDHAVPIDPLAAERVEVIRGPASLRWGSQAIGGVVNAINNRIPTTLPDRTVSGRVSGGWNSGSSGWDGTASVDTRAGNWVMHGDMFGRHDEDYRIPTGGRQANSFVRTDGQSIGLSYIGDQGFVGSSVSRFRSLYGIPGGEEAELGTAIDMEQLRWSGRAQYRPAAGPIQRIDAWLGFTQYHHEEIGAGHEPGEEARHVHGGFRNRSWDARLEAQHQPVATALGELNGSLGLSLEQERLRTTGEFLDFLPPANTDRYAGYVFEELTLRPGLRLQAAGRIETVRVDGSTAAFPTGNLPIDPDQDFDNQSRRRNFTPASASLGLLQDLPWSMQARLTGQYVERAPSAAELFSRGAHDASGTFDIGDPALRKESAKTIELGLGRASGSFRFDTSLFYSAYDGFIFRGLTGNSCAEDFASCAAGGSEDFRQVAYGQRNAHFHGAEAKAEQDLFRLGDGTVGVSARYDLVRAQFANGAGNLPRIPPQRLGGGVWWRSSSWQAGVDYLHAFDQKRLGENETPTKGYELLNARLAYTAAIADNAVTFALAGHNLLNDDLRNAASFKKDDVLLPGRSLRLLATLAF